MTWLDWLQVGVALWVGFGLLGVLLLAWLGIREWQAYSPEMRKPPRELPRVWLMFLVIGILMVLLWPVVFAMESIEDWWMHRKE